MPRIPLFTQLEIETSSMCRHRCKTCLRQNEPDRARVAPWFTQNYLPLTDIQRVLYEAKDAGFRGSVCLQHHNEPMLDPRIGSIARMAKSLKCFSHIFACTNAYYLTPRVIADVDGAFDALHVAVYRKPEQQQRIKEKLQKLFKKTMLAFTTGEHVATHYSHLATPELIEGRRMQPCPALYRMIVSHEGEHLLCCDDMVGRFNLGSIYDGRTVEQLWFSARHQYFYRNLLQFGGRFCHPYCMECPK